MVFREGGITPADAAPAVAAAKAPKKYSVGTALLVGEEIQVGRYARARFIRKRRSRGYGDFRYENGLEIIRPVSQRIYSGKFVEELPDLSREPAIVAGEFASWFSSSIGIKRRITIAQVEQGCRIYAERVLTPDGEGLFLNVESLLPLQPPQVFNTKTGELASPKK